MHAPRTQPATYRVLWIFSWRQIEAGATLGWLALGGAAAAIAMGPPARPHEAATTAAALFFVLAALPLLIVTFHPRLRRAHVTYLRTLVQPALPGAVLAVALTWDEPARQLAALWTQSSWGLFPLLPPLFLAGYAQRRTTRMQLGRGKAPSAPTRLFIYVAATACWCGAWLLALGTWIIL